MSDKTDLQSELKAWCASYIAAFEASDVAATSAHWTFPAVIMTGDRQTIMKDAGQFDKNTSALTGFYKRQKVQGIQRTVLSCHPMTVDSVSLRVHDVMSSSNDEKIVEWIAAYVLRRTEYGWRAIFADASGELAAWQARGTPLGSK